MAGIEGIGGVGKTSLAVAVAHATRNHFTGGQIHFLLGAHSGHPVSALNARRSWVQRLEGSIPVPEEEPVVEQMYRQHLARADGPVLVMIDDPANDADVNSLLPRPGDSVLIASRRRLAGFPVVVLEPLSLDDAVSLLVRWCERLRDTDEVKEIAQLCARLPVALEAAGRYLAKRVSKPIPEYLADLRADRVNALSNSAQGDARIDVEIVLAYSLRGLAVDESLALQLLVAISGSFSRELALQVATCTGDTLDTLVELGLLTFHPATQRFSAHDLLRELVRQGSMPETLLDAMRRYAKACIALLARCAASYVQGGTDAVAALNTFDTERGHFDEAFEFLRSDPASWRELLQLVQTIARLSPIRQTHADRIQWEQVALDCARQHNDRRSEGLHAGNLGTALAELGREDEATQQFHLSLEIATEVDDWRMRANQLENLAGSARRTGRLNEAHQSLQEALRVRVAHGDDDGQAGALGNLANVLMGLGDSDGATDAQRRALSIYERTRNLRGQVFALGNIGDLLLSRGRSDEATPVIERAVALADQIGDRRNEGWVIGLLGEVRLQQGALDQAKMLLERSNAISLEVSNPRGVVRAAIALADLDCKTEPPDLNSALRHLDVAMIACRTFNELRLEGAIAVRTSDVHFRLGDEDAGFRDLDAAATAFERAGDVRGMQLRSALAGQARFRRPS